MRAPLSALSILFVVGLLADCYIYFQSRRRCRWQGWSRIQLVSATVCTLLMIAAICLPARQESQMALKCKMWALLAWISIYLSKYIAIIFDLLAALPLMVHRHRCRWGTRAGIILASITFATIWWGALINRYRIQIRHVEIPVHNLPAAFNGFTICQFSDLHTGTFGTDTTFVSVLVDSINARKADLVVFTGDIVNSQTAELPPFMPTLSRLHAPYGVYAILGNHDYGDYRDWPSPAHKQANLHQLIDLYADSPLHLLVNETAWIHRDNDSIALIGVENIGEPPFTVYGSLSKAYPNLEDSATKVLLSHNPRHWVDSISANPAANVALTLSGHTHAMQIEIAGISPSALRYSTWGGLYKASKGSGFLYVNIGCGTVGLPMRIGATPEITLLTLKAI